MVAAGAGGSVVTLICDSGERYADTYFDDRWLAAHDLAPNGYTEVLTDFERSCTWPAPESVTDAPARPFRSAVCRCDRLSKLHAGCGAAW